MTRHEIARSVARNIETLDNCEVLSLASIAAIEHALSQYAVDRLRSLRERVVALTLSASEKSRALDIIDALINEDAA